MIDFYFWPTPNAYKVAVMLAEIGIPYRVMPINILEGEQHAPEFLDINPNGKVPAIVDPDGPDGKPIAIFESGAILLYLAEKTGKLLPTDSVRRYEALQWLMFQMGGFGPMLGQAHHFRVYAPEQIDYAVERYTREASRLYKVLDRRLAEVAFLAGEYSIADIATFTWAHRQQPDQTVADKAGHRVCRAGPEPAPGLYTGRGSGSVGRRKDPAGQRHPGVIRPRPDPDRRGRLQ